MPDPTAITSPANSSAANSSAANYEQLVERMLRQLNMGQGLDELLGSVFDQLSGVVPYNRIAVALLEEPAHVLRLVSCRSDGEVMLKTGYAARVAGSTLAPLLETGQPRIIADLEEYLRRKPGSSSTSLIVREGMRSSLTLPLLADAKPIGVIFFSSREPGIYTGDHAELLARLASPIAIGVEKTRLIGQLEQTNRDLASANLAKDDFLDTLKREVDKQTQQLRQSEARYRLLVEMGRVVNSSLDMREVFHHAAVQIRKQLGCDRVSLLLTSATSPVRHGFALEFDGERESWPELPTQSLPGSAFDWVMQHRVPQVVRSLQHGHDFPEDLRLLETGYGSKVYMPLLSRDQSVGVLGIVSRREHQPDQWDLELLREICSQLSIALDNASAYSEIDRLKQELEQQNVYLRDEIRTDHDFGNIIGDSPAMRQVRVAVEQVALTDSTVLILGETGTGKELIARAIHETSSRRENLLVKVNCASLAPNLIASELFGHEAGAFTGATELRKGRFELSDHGSIFLDEISEVPAETQVMLLRVLQEREIERVGGNAPIEIDTRVIAASNRDLKAAVAADEFRDDLYYRLNVFPISVPPLRQRREDIPALLNHFIARFSKRMNKPITRVDRHTMEILMQYEWPGNVREFENIIERSMIISRGDTLSIESSWLAGDGSSPSDAQGGALEATTAVQPTLAEIERRAILGALQRCDGKIYGPGGAAEALGLKPTTLYGKMRKQRIKTTRQHE
ncbi:sigma 54-interacting transcriptional regulator [Allorhodopirellula solitaria]|uniref:Formate hydrogenlyase transcriptional activator n=1 Tax=Allorhodopirellula solitaria TaxID=2527987 RepID=A0A5C5WNK3_9BACT|nr:sigma 54-interacting transcriptional regulator [Allorhodopirellula solitaria]TWT51785.1 Formate hydrogenlyase transcriptional activator [Allorhodopirellula solitaria]